MLGESFFTFGTSNIVVIGGTGHLGSAIVQAFVEAGANVLVVDKDREALGNLTGRERYHPYFCDLESCESRLDLARQCAKMFDRIDIIVNAAALVGTSDLEGWNTSFLDQSIDTWSRAMVVNLNSVFHICQLLTPLMCKKIGGAIINIGSIYGELGPDWRLYEGLDMSNAAAYSVSKGGLAQLTRWLASTLGPQIRINTVSPGGIYRQQPQSFVKRYEAKTPLGRMASEQDIVSVILFLASSAAGYITGQNICVDGGYSII